MSQSVLEVTAAEVRANRYDVLSRLADDLAHEIKNPLNAVVINLELVKRRVVAGVADQALDRLAVVEEETGRVHRLVEALLLLVRPPRDGGRSSEVGIVMDELLPLLRAQAKLARIELDYRPPPGVLSVAAPRDALKQALLNLFINAIEAIRPAHGRIELSIAVADGEAELRVRDSGSGVAPELADRLGEPGVTTRAGRAGLGLAVTRHIAREAGGRLTLESSGGDGSGTTFLLALPVPASA